MRKLLVCALLFGVVGLSTGAVPVEGVLQAQEWLHAGDIAMQGGQYGIAYTFYQKVAETFPNTKYGRLAVYRGAHAKDKLRHPAWRVPSGENFIREVVDLATW